MVCFWVVDDQASRVALLVHSFQVPFTNDLARWVGLLVRVKQIHVLAELELAIRVVIAWPFCRHLALPYLNRSLTILVA